MGILKPDWLHIILVQTKEPRNVGAVARAMRNCGITKLTLVAPRTEDWATARRIAVHAEDLLDSPRVVPSLQEAVADAVWIVGTTSRTLHGRPALSPRAVAATAASMQGEVALVFGGEESGLSNADLVRCHAVSTVPSGTEQPSFNLGQAVLLYAYEAFLAVQDRSIPAPNPTLASDGDISALETPLRDLLRTSGFADPDRPRHGVRDLLLTLRRAGLTKEEAHLWQAALHSALGAIRGRRSPKP